MGGRAGGRLSHSRFRAGNLLCAHTLWFESAVCFSCFPLSFLPAEVVFNSRGEREAALTAAGCDMLHAFETLLARLVEGPAVRVAEVPFSADVERQQDTSLEGEEAHMAAPLAALLQVRLPPV